MLLGSAHAVNVEKSLALNTTNPLDNMNHSVSTTSYLSSVIPTIAPTTSAESQLTLVKKADIPSTLSTGSSKSIETSVVGNDVNEEQDSTTSNNGSTAAGAGTASTGKGSGCFSSESSFVDILENDDITQIYIDELQEGDQVLVDSKDGTQVFQTYTGESYHKNMNQHFEFVQLTTADNSTLTATRNHYVMTLVDNKPTPVMAGQLRLGDTLIKNGEPVAISQVESVVEQGFNSPIIEKGQLQVNGFSVTTYSGLQLGGQDILGFPLTQKIIDSAASLTKQVYGENALKPDVDGNVQMPIQNMLESLNLQ
jgi:hypothetical protein